MKTVTLVFKTQDEALRADGLVDLQAVVDFSPSRRKLTIKQQFLIETLEWMRADGFSEVKILLD